MTRTLPFRDGLLTVVEVPRPFDPDRTGVELELRHDGLSRRLYLPMGKCPINQADLDRMDAELVISWWGRAG